LIAFPLKETAHEFQYDWVVIYHQSVLFHIELPLYSKSLRLTSHRRGIQKLLELNAFTKTVTLLFHIGKMHYRL
jgi:hypothetical protein